MHTHPHSSIIRFQDTQRSIPGPAGEHAVSLFQRGTLNAYLALGRHAPRPRPITSHAQDELYVILRGTGVLLHDGRRDPFGPGDLLFVSAGTDHRFEEFSDDLAVWALFYGPPGGELPPPKQAMGNRQ